MIDPADRADSLPGRLVAEYGTGSAQHWLALVGAPLLAATFIGFWVLALLKWGFTWNVGFMAVTLILVGLGVLLLVGGVVAFLARRWRLGLYENGLLLHRNRSDLWVAWQDVASYTEREVIMNGISLGHNCYLRLRTGKKVSIDSVFRSSAEIAALVKERLVPVLLDEAHRQLERNQMVDFQKLRFGREGLQVADEFILWSQVDSLALEDNKGMDYRVVLRGVGRAKPLLFVPVSSFPNLDVLLRLEAERNA